MVQTTVVAEDSRVSVHVDNSAGVAIDRLEETAEFLSKLHESGIPATIREHFAFDSSAEV
jgi:hypothetical protein